MLLQPAHDGPIDEGVKGREVHMDLKMAGLKKAKITDLEVQKTFLKSVSFQEIISEMERSRRVDRRGIFCFCPTRKTLEDMYLATWENFVSFHRI